MTKIEEWKERGYVETTNYELIIDKGRVWSTPFGGGQGWMEGESVSLVLRGVPGGAGGASAGGASGDASCEAQCFITLAGLGSSN